jgi:hypothetical protein
VSDSVHVRFVTCRKYPEGDPETSDLAALLNARGVRCDVQPWDADVDWCDPLLCVIRSAWDYHHHLDRFLDWADTTAECTDLRNPPELVRWNAHKGYLLNLESRGIPIVPTNVVPKGERQRLADAIRSFECAVVVKHAVSLDGEGMLRIEPPTALDDAALKLVDEGDVLVQPYVDSIAGQGEMSAVFIAGQFAHAVRKSAAPGEYRVQERYGGRTDETAIEPAFLALAHQVMASIAEVPLYARVDLVCWQGEPCLGELELIEPSLYLRAAPASRETFAQAIESALEQRQS